MSQENHINPCFCVSLRAGSILLSVHDIIYGIAYIFRVKYVQYLNKKFHEYFPDPLPNPTKSELVFEMSRIGNYIVTILLGVIMLLATNYLRYYYVWLAATCYFWLFIKTLLIISYTIFCNALLESDQSHFQRFGYEILVNIFVNLYFMLVVASFIRETRIELNNYRAIKPINIERGEHEEYLRNDKESKFNDATSYHFLSPDFFLNANKNVEQSRTRYNLDNHMDESLLQYEIASRKVEVVTDSETSGDTDTNDPKKKSFFTIKPITNISSMAMRGESESFLPSQMSILPDSDRDFESRGGGGLSHNDSNMSSKSQMTVDRSFTGTGVNNSTNSISTSASNKPRRSGNVETHPFTAEIEVSNLDVSSLSSTADEKK